jgi:D-amino-acid dehydrogenase
MSRKDVDVLVIGGGVIGVCTTHYLLEAGRQVTLLERDTVCSGCSHGNSGLVVPSHSFPLAVPGVIGQSLKWMLNPESPFFIRPRLDPALFKWLWRFRAACNHASMIHSIHALAQLSQVSIELYDRMISDEQLDCGYDRRGSFVLYRTPKGLEAGLKEARLLNENGITHRSMTGPEVHEMEPAIRADIAGGLFYERDAFLNPSKFVHALAERVREKGATIVEQTEVTRIECHGNRIERIRTPHGDYRPQQVVLAAGSWSSSLAGDLPFTLPVQPAKGYSVTFENPGVKLAYPLIMAEARAGVNPMGSMIRVAGTLEMTGIDLTINMRRVKTVVGSVGEYIEGIDEERALQNPWSGMRPCTPDGLPVIGVPSAVSNLIVATGHAMLGMTLGPGTGKLVADLACEREPSLDPVPYSPARFQ